MIPVPRGWEEAAPSSGPPVRDALPACALRAGCGAPGAVPALRLYCSCHLGSRVQGRATAPPSRRAQGKTIPRPSGQKQPRDSGARMNLGRDHTGRASFVFRCFHACPVGDPHPPVLADPRSGAPHFRDQLSGIPSLRPGGHRHCWALGRISALETALREERNFVFKNKDVVSPVESLLWAPGGGRPSAPALPDFLCVYKILGGLRMALSAIAPAPNPGFHPQHLETKVKYGEKLHLE